MIYLILKSRKSYQRNSKKALALKIHKNFRKKIHLDYFFLRSDVIKQKMPAWQLSGRVSQGPRDTLGVVQHKLSSDSDHKLDLRETTSSDETILELCTMRDCASRTFQNRWKSNEIENTISHSILFVLLGRLTISTSINHFTRALVVTIISHLLIMACLVQTMASRTNHSKMQNSIFVCLSLSLRSKFPEKAHVSVYTPVSVFFCTVLFMQIILCNLFTSLLS